MGELSKIIILALVVTGSASSYAGTMTAEIDRMQSSLDEPFNMNVTVQGSLDGELIEPESKDFEFNRTGTSTNISVVNGTITKERQYSYQVRALKEGRLTIPSLKARVDEEDLQTTPFQVEVKGGVAEPSREDVKSNTKLIFVERELPKKTMYQGEVIISKIRLLTRAQLTGATPSRDAAPDWRLIGTEGQKNSEVVRDGARWNVIEMSEGLIPLKVGKIKAPSFGISATWIQPSARKQRNPQNIFDMLRNGNLSMGEEVSKKLFSDVIEVEVKPLPNPRPAEFSDIVGAFTLTSNISKRKIGAGETATVTLEIKGQGALDHMKDVVLTIVGARVYADKPVLTEKIEVGAGLVSTKILKFAVVPNAQGTVDLGSVKLASFNTFTESYETMTVNLGALEVGVPSLTPTGTGAVSSNPAVPAAGSTEASATASATPNAASPVAVPNTPLVPRVVTDQPEVVRPWFLGPVALAIEILLVAGLFGGLILRRGLRRLKSSAPSVKKKTAKQWQGLITELAAGDRLIFDRAVAQLKEILSANSKDPLAMTSRDLILSAEAMKFEPVQVEVLRRLLKELDRLAYSDASNQSLESSSLADLTALLTYCQSRGI